jgi:predicted hydrolase (HD superfamily)
MTNGDKIRSMTDKELTEWLDKQYNQDREDWTPLGCYHCADYGTHHYPEDCGDCEWLGGIMGWLQQEYKK